MPHLDDVISREKMFWFMSTRFNNLLGWMPLCSLTLM